MGLPRTLGAAPRLGAKEFPWASPGLENEQVSSTRPERFFLTWTDLVLPLYCALMAISAIPHPHPLAADMATLR